MAEVKLNEPVADQMRKQYPSNSISKPIQPEQPQKKVEGVVKNKGILQKETVGMKLKKWFMPGDLKDVRDYAVKQVLIPTVKTSIVSIVEIMMWGQATRRVGNPTTQRTNYSYISNNGSNIGSTQQRTQPTNNFRNVTFLTYQDAEDVISTLLDLVDRYGMARVTDFYEAARVDGIDDLDWAAVDWGWTGFTKLESRRVHEGYVIDMPPPVYLRRSK